MSERIWHVAVGGETQGPFTLEEVVARIGRDVGPDTQVWNPQMSAWSAARSVPELAARLTAPAPPPPAPTPPPRVAAPPPPRPLPPRPANVAPAAPSAEIRPRPTPSPSASEEPTLNPFKLIARAFRWRGRFDRGEFAMLWFGVALLNGLFLGLVFLLTAGLGQALGGDKGVAAGMLAFWGVLILDLIGATLVNFGALVRRLNDLGKPAWWMLGAFVPLLNLVLIIYLLVAPGDPNAELPESFQGAVIAIGAVCGVSVLGGGAIIAAIAIPALMRARISANEAGALGDVRSVISAEVAYSSMNAGFYESRFECLHQPDSCMPGYTGPPFLDATLGEQPKGGYLRKLYGGEPAVGAGSPSSVTSFAIVAWPVQQGQTGVRAFCGDATGIVCSATGAEPSTLVDGSSGEMRCSSSCQPLY